MTATSGWDTLVVSLTTTADGFDLRVGAVGLLLLIWVAAKATDLFEDDEPPKPPPG